MPDSQTRLLGLIGDPVEHSLSPLLHSFLISRAGLNFCYLAFRVPRESLSGAILGMRALGIRGLNVTIPHKEAVVPFLDRLSPEAEAVGAVNTIASQDGELVGYNTDIQGFLAPLLARGVSLAGKRAVVLGAGGGAAACAYALLREGAEVAITSRTPERTLALARRLSRFGTVSAHPLEGLPVLLAEADLLVNATPVGMHPHPEGCPLPPELLREDLLVYDLVYNPTPTRLLREAAARGATAIGGLEMLVWQGAKALKLWTGHRFPPEAMKQAVSHLKEALHG
ncbi:MAG: Shikimate dehydrogenase [Acetothermia bacterium 64_32]|nr:MAG: Shikimate dehydrogenase [Acetothermia bacterium 64_32]